MNTGDRRPHVCAIHRPGTDPSRCLDCGAVLSVPPTGADPVLWDVFAPLPHQHTWTWTSGNTLQVGVPDLAMCACGLTYAKFKAQVA